MNKIIMGAIAYYHIVHSQEEAQRFDASIIFELLLATRMRREHWYKLQRPPCSLSIQDIPRMQSGAQNEAMCIHTKHSIRQNFCMNSKPMMIKKTC